MLHFIQYLAVRKHQAGLTTVEYAVAGGLITAAVVGAFVALGGSVNGVISGLSTSIGG
ncbi:pilus assembly protein Flp/PilA [Solimonas aquatica]|uniref:Pilus assembly protein Flp/PilA n=1 Tax=Solimonas aquatica TaxID=489703 RepID=A0A1H9HXE0_9GAMM|nr:Flp family type IVb pilin [Solimonas aquatica]SEQ67029.1 pilus assembly protein Flp/PilA [Solimonas aquatica]